MFSEKKKIVKELQKQTIHEQNSKQNKKDAIVKINFGEQCTFYSSLEMQA